jgi:hypothetical protein
MLLAVLSDDELAVFMQTVKDQFLSFTEQFHAVDEALAKQRIALSALKGIVAAQIFPKDIDRGLQEIERLETILTERDPSAQARQENADIIEAFKLAEKHGSHES